MNYLSEAAETGYNSSNIDPFHQVMVPWLLRSEGVNVGDAILDIGAGLGHCLIPTFNNGWRNLYALDIDELNFDFFRRTYGIKTLLCDVATQKIALDDECVAAVFCFHLIEHLPRPQNLMSEIYRVLRRGGKVFLVTPDWRKQYKTFWRDPTHVHPYDKESVARLFRMFNFEVQVHSWNARFGLGRVQAYRWFPRLGMIGLDLIALATKK